MPFANRNYNTRNSGRFNTPGNFVPAAQEVQQQQQQQQQHQQQQQQNYSDMYQTSQQQNNLAKQLNQPDVEMKPTMETAPAGDDPARPHWMKNKLMGVKKISNKERRRRQNETLRRLLSPKNAVMVLNEIMPGEQVANQFKVEAAQPTGYYGRPHPVQPGFCADLTLEGQNYKGFGETKMNARNAAAEQAIRDIIIKRMNKVLTTDAASTTSNGAGAGSDGEEEKESEALPMLQLASFALHKLFSEWEFEGHKVPQLKPPGSSVSESGAPEVEAPKPKAKAAKQAGKPREVPVNAAQLHPCMLLTYMRPALEYRPLGVEGERQQDLIFTVGVDVDGATYIGKARNKKEARRVAAAAACRALFNVVCDETPSATTPVNA